MERKKLISVADLKEILDDPDLVLLDCSLGQSVSGKQSAFSGKTIPGARFFDLKNKFSDTSSAFPNTLPAPEDLEQEARALGINQDSKIVVFDAMGIYSSPRVWWMFQVMSHPNTVVLDGGLPAWIEQHLLLAEQFQEDFEPGNFKAEFDSTCFKSFEDVEQNVEKQDFMIVDARSAGRFKGIEPEPRPSLQSGSIPHSVNIPFEEVLENGKFKSPTELKSIFEKRSLLDENLVYSCGSGLTACIILLAGELAGQKGLQLYDGSWTEWAELKNLKK